MLLPGHQNAAQNRDTEIANRSFENVSQFKYLGMTATNQNSIQEEIKRGLNSGNACYHSVQNLLSSRLLSKNLKIRIHKTVILPVVLCGCQTLSLTLREEHRQEQTKTKERASRQAHPQGNNKNKEGKQRKTHNTKHMQSVTM
jgi:hypothetical protein